MPTMIRGFEKHRLPALLGGAALLLSLHAHGQGGPGSIEEVLVTAQKRSERIVDVPISMSVATSESLQSAGITSVTELGQIVPGLRMDFQGAFLQPTIRGVTSAVAGPGMSAPIATYVDGFYYPSQLGGNFEFSDITSVQVLKGPQGTLFGRNATGGAILITTKDPSFEPEGVFTVGYGKYNETRGQMYVSGPLTSKLAASLTMHGRKIQGYAENIVSGRREGDNEAYAIRAKLLYRPTDDTDITFSYLRNHVDNPSATIYNIYEGRANSAFIPGVAIPVRRGDVAHDYPSENEVETDGFFLKVETDLDWATLTSFTSFQELDQPKAQFDLDATFVPILHATNYSDAGETFTQEFNLGGSGDRIDWVAGLFFMNDRWKQDPVTLSIGGGAPTEILINQLNTKTYAAFADATYDLTEKLFLTLGARYEISDVDGWYATPVYAETKTSASHTFRGFTPRAVISYEVATDSNVYLSFGKGLKSGTFNFGGLNTQPVDPEKITSYELGFKTQQPAWSFEAAAFYYDYKDLQVTAYEGAVTTLQNAAEAEIYGVEAHLAASLTDRLRLDVGVTYLKAEYEEFEGAPMTIWDPAAGLAAVSGDASGNTMARTPEFSGNISLVYEQPLLNGQLELSGNYAYQSRIYFEAFESIEQGSYGLLNLRGAWTAPAGNWTVALYAKNVTDEKYFVQYTPEPVSELVQYGWPFTYGAELSVRF